jgi:putative toxin-antitoxin system antitoxin component (TIGR02293 family)
VYDETKGFAVMTHAQTARSRPEIADSTGKPIVGRTSPARKASVRSASAPKTVTLAFVANKGLQKVDASRLFQRVAATSAFPLGKVRAELIPDSSWKRAGKVLGLQASQTAARLSYVLALAERVWGNESDATTWLNSPHPELRGATPFSLLKTEAGGRAVEALLGALEFGFPA